MGADFSQADEFCVNTIRTLSMDAVQKAGSGHPGTPMGLALIAEILWTRFLKFDPGAPGWPDRDRFVLSCGHASMLLYSLLHLAGFQVSLEDLQRFRQWGSITPGHPEYGMTPGVEATTGPLGQGIGNAVGMALAERMLAARFNGVADHVIDHRTWVLASDGDIMEGVASEACSLAGHLGLHRLTVIYDDNKITIDGSTHLSFSEDVGARYAAYGWHVQKIDGHDPDAIHDALAAAVAEENRPSFIVARTHIGYGAPHKQDTAAAHGAPLGEDEIRAAKLFYGVDPEAHFLVPEEACRPLASRAMAGREARKDWEARMAAFRRESPMRASLLEAAEKGQLPQGWDQGLPRFQEEGGEMATRSASARTLAALAARVPFLVGGSADLAASNKTDIPQGGSVARESYAGRNLHFGIREHGMGAILNGMALHGGFRAFGSTFMVFSDYCRPSIRLAALSRLPVIYVLTHESIGLGSDGPTHQPVEHLAALRAIPNVQVIRPADAHETVEAWKAALRRMEGPTILALSRQNLPVLSRKNLAAASGLARGAYVLADGSSGKPDLILMASGSEVPLILKARAELEGEGLSTRVVSFPCWELFAEQPQQYREQVLPLSVSARLAVEAASGMGWERWVGDHGAVVALDRFGASAPGSVVMEKLGFSLANVISKARGLTGR
ncbi:MAG: transketolase [Acidobacteriota bacterium]